ncbi:hypothetical protein BGX23_003190 [Mortierella sp. AD031]|nr:hypothetical protein BGX23_003190 [Mortierella sp. AD031]KAG0211887.1 hypothetical protein BGX33_003982 [Mortierella sp. NVP41]
MTKTRYEKEREENLRMNQQVMTELFGSSTPAAALRQEMKRLDDIVGQGSSTSSSVRPNLPRHLAFKTYFSNRDVDDLERIERRDRRAQSEDDDDASSTSTTPSPPNRTRTRYIFDHVYIQRRTSRQAARETTAMHCSRCKVRFDYACLKKWYNITVDKSFASWLCPICRDFCNCSVCRENKWKFPNGKKASRELSPDESGPDEEYGDDEFASGGRGGGGYNQQRDRPGLSLRSRTTRAAVRAATERLREVDSFSESESEFIIVKAYSKNKNRNRDEDEEKDEDEEAETDAEEGDDDETEDTLVNRSGKRRQATPHRRPRRTLRRL